MSLPPDLDSVVAGKIYVVGSIVLPVAILDLHLGVLIAYSLTPLPTNSFPGGPSACYIYIYIAKDPLPTGRKGKGVHAHLGPSGGLGILDYSRGARGGRIRWQWGPQFAAPIIISAPRSRP